MKYDYIIVGSGLAGLNAALRASEHGSVLVVTKKRLADANTFYAQGGIAAVWSKSDNFAGHISDTITAGAGHNNRKAVNFIIRNGPSAIRRLIRLGIRFTHKQNDGLSLNLEGGHGQNRIINAGDRTGRVIETALISKIKANKNITVMENALAVDLLVHDKICHGICVFKGHKFTNLFAQRTVIASGGLAQIYEENTNPETATGDGIAMAHRAGCKIKDLEFVQFHPTALKSKMAPLFLLSETLRGHGAGLINQKGEHFMAKIHPMGDLAPRDIISRAIFNEEKKGDVFLDTIKIDKKIFKKGFPQIDAKLSSLGIDPSKQPIPVTPAAHYTCGGIKTDLRGKTGIKNLYAFGETSCTGLHGANRLASNSLLEAIVMSEQVKTLPEFKTKVKSNQDFTLPEYKKQQDTGALRNELKQIMWKDVGIIRKQKDLAKAMVKLTNLQKKLPPPTDQQAIITGNMLTCAILVTRAAIARKKSLGCHFILP